jgi:prephenate dehydrogenase
LTVAIVGLGLIGTSIALALRRAQPDAAIVGIDRDDVIRHPRIVDTFSAAATELDAVAAADIVVLATPVDVILQIIPAIQHIANDALVLDTGSTKRAILAAARDAGLSRFVGGHPMAGAEQSGPDAARIDLFDGKPWFLMGDASAAMEAGAFVQRLGATAIFLTDDGSGHDRLMAAISHLPQVVASALMARVGETAGSEGLAYSGTGLRDTTRLAASEARVWESVLATNADSLAPLLKELARDLDGFADRLQDGHAVRRLFGLANLYRRNL